MADPEGRTEAIKKRLMVLIQNANNALDSTNVAGDQDKVKSHIVANELPYITVKLPLSSDMNVYGRRTPNAGRYIVQPFTLHLFHSACTDSGESRNRWAHQIADDIMDYLDSRRGLEGANKICDIYALRAREAKVRGAGTRTVRYIIEGELMVLREDV